MSRAPKRGVDKKGRNIGAKHVRLHLWLIESEAYRALRPAARALLVELYLRHNGINNGYIFLSYPSTEMARARTVKYMLKGARPEACKMLKIGYSY